MKVRSKQILFRIIFSIFIILAGSISALIAQDNDIRFNHYTVEDGLSQNSVYSILQDQHGFMWFGTRTGGLNRFDGYSFTTYKKRANDSLSISSNEILALCEDKYGMIWIGTRNGSVSRYDESYNRFFNYADKSGSPNSIPSKTVSCIFEDTQGSLWFGTNYGLCNYDREKDNFIRHEVNESFKRICIKAIVQAGNDLFWIGSKSGIYLYNTQTRKILKHYKHEKDNPTSLSDSYIMDLAIDAKGKLWVGTYKNGLNRLDDSEKGIFAHFTSDIKNKNSINSNVIRTLHFDKKDVLWVGTKIALEKLLPNQQNLDNPSFIHYQKKENNPYSINQNSIFSIYEAKDDNIWIGNYSGGVNQFNNNPKQFNRITRKTLNVNRADSHIVSCFAETEKGTWVGSEGGVLYLFEHETRISKSFTKNAKQSYVFENNHIKALYVDISGDLWVATFNGLYIYDKKADKFKVCIKDKYIYSIAEGLPGEIWVGSVQGVYKIDKSNFKIIESCLGVKDKIKISANNVQKVYKDTKERIWILTKTGLYRYNRKLDNYDGFFHDDSDKYSLSHSYCTSINEDSEGNIWIGTHDGVNRFDEKNMQFEHIGEAIGLPDNVVNNILFDNKGNLWLTTNKGLSKIEKSFFLNKTLINSTNNKIRNFDAEDGLVDTELKQNASFKNKKGELFFGGLGGFNFFYPDSIVDNRHIPKIALTGFKLFNKEVALGTEYSLLTKPIWLTESITLNHKQSVVSFEFAVFNYTSPLKNQYAYMLEGYDKEWNYSGTKHEATYTSLPAGDYVFRMKVSNNDGLWNTEGCSLKIKIIPPFWERWWFRLIAIGVISALIALYLFVRISKERRRNSLLEATVSERTFELREKNKLLLQKSEQIRIQHDKLAEANRVKDKLFSVIAHDLRNPFNSIMGFSEMLVSDFHEISDDEKEEYAKHIYNSSSILFDLLARLLLWSRSQRGTITPAFKLHDIIKLLITNIEIAELQAKDKNIQIRMNFKADEFKVTLDADLIDTVIRNLLSNAIKFTHTNGEIVLSCFNEGDMITVRVKDNGVGMSTAAQTKIFRNNTECIRAGTNNEKGTGLGLLICQDFIDIHNGKIWVNSEVGKGSEFCFSLPLKQED